ncbi:hypothetical protein RCL_jg25420.t1 [Rhizophagus clarus]|uniref:Uncharacterized protein n=1 Tax=Rhizophagus clarus TaxID=94130 RepID=A0A8H3LBG1_9GLOM|nr:hypothetical protein RCL_jg25420.t1 [Rhizophagus clarus]
MIPSLSTNIAKYHKLGEDVIQFIDFCMQNETTAHGFTARKGRPAGRTKSCVEIQDKHTRKCRHLQPLDDNNQTPYNETSGSNNNEKDK